MTSWIFQGNPKKFRIDEYLRNRQLITWGIKQTYFKDEISNGNEVFIWRADGDKPGSGGIVAKGEILSRPTEIKDDAPKLWNKPPEKLIELRVIIKLEEVRLGEGMLKRVDLKEDPTASTMIILKFPKETNYKLEPLHAQYIKQLWEQRKKQTGH